MSSAPISPTAAALPEQAESRFDADTHPREQDAGSPGLTRVAEGVWRLATANANAYLVAGDNGDWTLIDAGISGFTSRFTAAADRLFDGRPPRAIVLTHGHFDHVGNLQSLLDLWPDVPVFAHPRERPYLDGTSDYPPPDPTVGGFESHLSRLYPNSGINVGGRLRDLPGDGSVPNLPGWRWHATPGHTVGHVSLFREVDRVLIAGDAVITVDQEHLHDFVARPPVLHGPPVYFTTHWDDAVRSVRRVAELKPLVLVTGHGQAVAGNDLPAPPSRLRRRFPPAAARPLRRQPAGPRPAPRRAAICRRSRRTGR